MAVDGHIERNSRQWSLVTGFLKQFSGRKEEEKSGSGCEEKEDCFPICGTII